MDEVLLNNEVETENLINYGEEGITPNYPIEDDTLVLSSSDTVELLTSSDDTQVLAPDAISVDSGNEISIPSETGSTESASVNIENSQHNIDDLYTLLQNGVTVNIQSEFETENTNQESEISLYDIYTMMQETKNLESEAFMYMNENMLRADNNSNTFGFIGVGLLSALLGGLVAIGFLKGLK